MTFPFLFGGVPDNRGNSMSVVGMGKAHGLFVGLLYGDNYFSGLATIRIPG
jgi:hypothetical protein